MKKVFLILLLCSSLFAEDSTEAIKKLKDKHKDANDIHKVHKEEFENIKKILAEILLTQVNTIFELTKESELIFLTMQAEGERDMMTSIMFRSIFE
jgi:hypothetical protein